MKNDGEYNEIKLNADHYRSMQKPFFHFIGIVPHHKMCLNPIYLLTSSKKQLNEKLFNLLM